VTLTTAVDQTREPALSSERGLSHSYARPRRTPLNWVRGGGLAAFLFLLPLLFVFGAFSWYPIVRTAIMAFQHTNFVEAPTWVGFQNFAAVWHDPQFPIAVKNTAYFALLALLFGYPIPLIAAVLMSEVRKRRGLYSVLAFLPVVIPPVVGVLLWKTFYDASSQGVFNTVLHWVGLGPYPWLQSQQWAMPSIVLYSTWANAGATIII
jgi:multiple sugar transport system permease protein